MAPFARPLTMYIYLSAMQTSKGGACLAVLLRRLKNIFCLEKKTTTIDLCATRAVHEFQVTITRT